MICRVLYCVPDQRLKMDPVQVLDGRLLQEHLRWVGDVVRC